MDRQEIRISDLQEDGGLQCSHDCLADHGYF